jgi:hypothetical protein
VVSSFANELRQLLFQIVLEGLLVGSLGRIGALSPIGLFGRSISAYSPEIVLRPFHHPQLVGRIIPGNVMGVMAFPDKIEAGILHELHVPVEAGIGLGNAPASTIVVGIYANDQEVRSIEEEPLLGRPLD